MNNTNIPADVEKPVVIPVEAYVSGEYLRAENDKLWPKVWQIACREEELRNVGDYVTYDILDESIINMPEVQKGIKSRGFMGPRPSPLQEVPVIHFHRNLAEYMGTGAPEKLES